MKQKENIMKGTAGITLVALAITIVVLLILAGVTLNLLLDDNGIIRRAQEAVNAYNEDIEQTKGALKNLADSMDEYSSKGWKYDHETQTVKKGKVELKIGDYVNYNHTAGATKTSETSYEADNGYGDQVFNLSSYTGGWRVLGEENGNLLLISEDIIGPDSGGYEHTVNGNLFFF